jgi:ring-1,2-phenylacetyl-CoA epoxidase subunit PaaE
MSRFHSLQIKDVRKETEDTVSISFEVPADLKETFRFKHGQYLTIKIPVNGEELRRSYSICTSPQENDLRIAVKKIKDGRVSSFLNDRLTAGQSVELMPPMGNFTTELSPSNRKAYVAFAAGSGITPIMSILKTVLASEPGSSFTLFYGNKDNNTVIFKDELDRLQAKFSDRLRVHLLYSRQAVADRLFEGRIGKEKVAELLLKYPQLGQANEYFLCGPQEMIENTSALLQERGVAKDNIHFELFTTAVPTETEVVTPAVPVESGVAKVTIVLDGDESVIDVKPGISILDSALDAGLDAPYACTGGSCCTCRAKIIEGAATMDVNYALTDKEVNQGYILTCQSHPTTPTMVVDYDAS